MSFDYRPWDLAGSGEPVWRGFHRLKTCLKILLCARCS